MLSKGSAIRSPSLPYVGPFVLFLILLALSRVAPFPEWLVQSGFVAIMLVAIAMLAPRAWDLQHGFRVRHGTGTVLLGFLVFVIWIAPDLLVPGYRHSWLFKNALLGSAEPGLSIGAHGQAAILSLRAFRAVAIVPLVEELFWRAWLMRWLISVHFLKIPLGTWSAGAFWIVAVLFASEHGAYWDTGLAAGVLYNWWMVRTRSLADLMLAHAVTNACLSAYVVIAGKWEYWS
ncbi:MAG: CAAX prenyl protease-related protein [Acidobacteriaceae bacterium]|nr:CAAX prenyl protease-related protein [Acidobacteriaceae bacterium]